jgi:hypothetical protein
MSYPPPGVPEVPNILARVGAATFLKKEAQAFALWRDAFQAAERNPSRNWYLNIVEIATKLKAPDQLSEALVRSVEHPRGYTPDEAQIETILAWLERQDNPARSDKVLSILIEDLPDHPGIINRYYYIKALYGKASLNDLETMKELIEDDPDQSRYQGTLALLHLQMSQPQAALKAIEELAADPASLPTNLAVIRAAALGASGKRDEAKESLKRVNWNLLRSSEAVALRKLLPNDAPTGDSSSLRHTLLYRKALLSKPNQNDLREIRALVAKHPDRPDYQATLALTLLKTDKPEEVLEVLGDKTANPGDLSVVTAAVYAAALHRLERADEAEAVIAGIDWSKIPFAEAQALRANFPE